MEIPELTRLLQSSRYILALVGAGLSAPSGIPTFSDPSRQPYWRMAEKSTFDRDPLSVWRFYEDMRLTAMDAQPNEGHKTLAILAHAKPNLMAITQNIDELSERAGHDNARLAPIHGSLFTIVCSRDDCKYKARNLYRQSLLSTDANISHLPTCPYCHGLLRPGVVWMGEMLAEGTLQRIDEWFDSVPQVDLVLVIGMSGRLSAGFIYDSRIRGASVAHFNISRNELIESGDWYVEGSIEETLPRLVVESLGS